VRSKFLVAGVTGVIIGLSGQVEALDPKDLPALQAAVHEFCVQPDRKGDYLKIEGDLDAGATLKIVGLGATGKVTKETWDGINQRLDQYKTDPRECAISMVGMLAPLLTTPAKIEHPDVTLAFTWEKSPALMVINQSNTLARDIRWTVALWNVDDPRVYSNPSAPYAADKHEPLPIPTSTIDFIRANTKAGPLNLFDTPTIRPYMTPGDHLVGSASVQCADCERGHTFKVYIVLDNGGWYSEVTNITSGEVLVPKRLTKQAVSQAVEEFIQSVPAQNRVAIVDLF
jgi:hypothetical protein